MIRRINKFIFLLIIVGLCLYLVVLNPAPVNVRLTPSSAISMPGGIAFISVFFLGMIVAGIFGVWLGIRSYIRERGYRARERDRESFFREFMEARERSASEETGAAQEKWERIVRRERESAPGAIARVELSRTLEKSGDIRAALRYLDEARAILPENTEALFGAAELHMRTGNKTAAVDNLALVMYHSPNRKAASKLRDLSEDLGRFEDALEYNRQLLRMGGSDADCSIFERRIRFKQIVDTEDAPDREKRRSALLSLIRQHGESSEALEALAAIAEEDGRIDESAQYLSRAARLNASPALWHQVAKLWLRHDNAQRALAAARSGCSESEGKDRIRAKIDLARLHMTLNMPEEALKIIEETSPAAAKEFGTDINCHGKTDYNMILSVLKGVCLTRLNRDSEAEVVWEQLSRYDCGRHLSMLRGG